MSNGMNSEQFREFLKTSTENIERQIQYQIEDKITELLYKIIEGSCKNKELEDKNGLYVPELFFSNGEYVGNNPLIWARSDENEK